MFYHQYNKKEQRVKTIENITKDVDDNNNNNNKKKP